MHDAILDKKFTKSPIADVKSFFPIPDQLSIDSDWPQSTATFSWVQNPIPEAYIAVPVPVNQRFGVKRIVNHE